MGKQYVVNIYSGILFSLKKDEKILTHAVTWIKLEDIILNEISLSPKDE
jgi:hypothetical protein